MSFIIFDNIPAIVLSVYGNLAEITPSQAYPNQGLVRDLQTERIQSFFIESRDKVYFFPEVNHVGSNGFEFFFTSVQIVGQLVQLSGEIGRILRSGARVSFSFPLDEGRLEIYNHRIHGWMLKAVATKGQPYGYIAGDSSGERVFI